jgi:hypothetical protein
MIKSKKSIVALSFRLLKVFVVVSCILAFFIELHDIWTHFHSGLTNTAVKTKYLKTMDMPIVTICAPIGFRRGDDIPLTYEELVSNTYNLTDFFHDSMIEKLSNESEYTVTVLHSVYMGRCYSIDRIEKVIQNDYSMVLSFKNNLDVVAWVHEPGDELFLIYGMFSYPVTQIEIDVNNDRGMRAVDFQIVKEYERKLAKVDFKCAVVTNQEYANCVEDEWKRRLVKSLNCTSMSLYDLDLQLPYCNTTNDALTAFWEGNDIMKELLQDYVCPVMCDRYISIATLLTLTTEHRGRWHRSRYK